MIDCYEFLFEKNNEFIGESSSKTQNNLIIELITCSIISDHWMDGGWWAQGKNLLLISKESLMTIIIVHLAERKVQSSVKDVEEYNILKSSQPK